MREAVRFRIRAERPNLAAAPDDSHSNLGWDTDLFAFLSQQSGVGGAQNLATLSLHPLRLNCNHDNYSQASLELAGRPISEATTCREPSLFFEGVAELRSAASSDLL